MLGAPPALANTRFPVASSDVIGREPPEARATDKPPETGRKESVSISLEKTKNASNVLSVPTTPMKKVYPLAEFSPLITVLYFTNQRLFIILKEPRGLKTLMSMNRIGEKRISYIFILKSQLISSTQKYLLNPIILI